jgi:hypothetical protein
MPQRSHPTLVAVIGVSLILSCAKALVVPCGVQRIQESFIHTRAKLNVADVAKRRLLEPRVTTKQSSRLLKHTMSLSHGAKSAETIQVLSEKFVYFFRLVAAFASWICYTSRYGAVQTSRGRLSHLLTARFLSSAAQFLVMVQLMIMALFGAVRPVYAAVIGPPSRPAQEYSRAYEMTSTPEEPMQSEFEVLDAMPASNKGTVLSKRILQGTVGVLVVLPVAVSAK